MIVFLSGGAKNGKSSLAQDLTVALSQGKHYYIATMIPVDGEDRERIRLHIADRAGMGFETIECGRNILSCLDSADKNGAFLLDSATALLMNELFREDKNYEMDLPAACRCAEEIVTFAKSVANIVIVSDYIYSDANRYGEATEIYRRCLADIDRKLAQISDTVIEVSAGQCIVHKMCHWEQIRRLVRQSPDNRELPDCAHREGGRCV